MNALGVLRDRGLYFLSFQSIFYIFASFCQMQASKSFSFRGKKRHWGEEFMKGGPSKGPSIGLDGAGGVAERR